MTLCNITAHTSEYVILAETPEMYSHTRVDEYIRQEVSRPSKQWILHIINEEQETDQVMLRTDDFVLLPDTERVNSYTKTTYPRRPHSKRVLNWLAIAHDRGLRTLRDLRGQHLPLLRDMLQLCLESVENETGIRQEQVMAYVHYPPSVYQLHVHFSYPYGQYCHRDAYRVHNLATIINNLEIDPEFYAKATLYMALYPLSPHCMALADALREGRQREHKRITDVKKQAPQLIITESRMPPSVDTKLAS